MLRILYLAMLGMALTMGALILDMLSDGPIVARVGVAVTFGAIGLCSVWGVISNGEFE